MWFVPWTGMYMTHVTCLALPYTGSVTLVKSLYLSGPQFPICKMWLMILPLLRVYSDCKLFAAGTVCTVCLYNT